MRTTFPLTPVSMFSAGFRASNIDGQPWIDQPVADAPDSSAEVDIVAASVVAIVRTAINFREDGRTFTVYSSHRAGMANRHRKQSSN